MILPINKISDDLLINITHELKTPINGIVGMSQLLECSDLDNDQKEYVNIINDCSKQLLNLIDNFFSFTKNKSNKFDLRSCIEECYYNLILEVEKKNIDFIFTIDDNVPKYIITDSCKIKQIINNILSNAVKYTFTGYIHTKITCNIYGEDCDLIFSIEDTGKGIPCNKTNNIFNNYYQCSSDNPGLGIGLYITKKLVNSLNGNINVSSSTKGSIFTFNIITKYYNDILYNNHKKLECLLLVDQKTNNYIKEYYKHELKSINVNCTINHYINNIDYYDCIMIDVTTENMCQYLNKLKNMYNIPLIAITNVSNLCNYDVDYKITKPFRQKMLTKIFQQLIFNEGNSVE